MQQRDDFAEPSCSLTLIKNEMKPPLIVHQLPAAPTFVGREDELQAMHRFSDHRSGVLGLVGIGGAGKTALLRHFLDQALDSGRWQGVVVWSFYDDPDTNAFLKTAVEYVSDQPVSLASGTGWFHALRQALESGGRFLFVLDGLERVQRSATDVQGMYGELEDALLRGFLARLVTGGCESQAVITSRFPISDLDRWTGKGYAVIDIDQLDQSTAFHVLRSHGLTGSNEELSRLTREYGRHALTVDILGAAAVRFFDGQPALVPHVEQRIGEEAPDSATRLASVLTMFLDRMDPKICDLMSRVCVFRFGVTLDSLTSVFLNGSQSAGTLVGATREQLSEWIDWLVDAHLVHRELGDKFTVHPAVRDHFYRLFRDAADVHGAISGHLLSLSERPGIGLPVAKEALDLLEELVYHALQAGQLEEATEIFGYRMGGNEHLNVTLGEYARTYRILNAFPKVVDTGAMYYCLRAFGDFESAIKWRPQNRYIFIACGRLEELREDASETTRKAVRFLMGEGRRVPERMADFPISAAHLHLLAGELEDAEAAAHHEIKVAFFHDDVARSQLALGEIARRKGQLQESRRLMDAASDWVLSSGSHEHLCTMFLYRGRLELDCGEIASARSTLDEAAHVADESGFLLMNIEIWTEMARAASLGGDHARAMEMAAEAAAQAHGVRFAWGEAAALRRVADEAAILGLQDDQRQALERLVEIQRAVSDPHILRTELAIKALL